MADVKAVTAPSPGAKRRGNSSPVAIASLFDQFQLEDKGGHITQEFQDFGYRLAMDLDDPAHKSLYMRMAKREDRLLLENALSFVTDANAKSKAKLFMWKVTELKKQAKLSAQNQRKTNE